MNCAIDSRDWSCGISGKVIDKSNSSACNVMCKRVCASEESCVNSGRRCHVKLSGKRRDTCSDGKREWHVTSRQAKSVERDEPQ